MRLNATTKAPIVNFSGEAAQGAATIRAFQMVEKFKRKNLCLIDNDSSLYFHNSAALEWLIQRLEFLSNILLCATGLLLVIFPTSSPGCCLTLDLQILFPDSTILHSVLRINHKS